MEELKKVNKQMYECYAKTAANIITYCNDEDREPMLNDLRGHIEKLCDLEERISAVKQITEVLESHDPEAENAEDAQKAAEEYKTKISSIVTDASNNPNLKEFDRTVNVLKAEADGSDRDGADGGDRELQLTQDTINVIDPITKQRMTDPVRNILCSHVYDRESVEGLIKMNAMTRCPVPGCKYTEYLSMANMITDQLTKIYLEKYPA